VPSRIYHVATEADWRAAQQTGTYTTSTRGRSLAEEGFIHASREDQWQGVHDRFYADLDEPLLLLAIDTARLDAPVIEEAVPDSDETFPHVYGPITVDSVVDVRRIGDAASFSRLFFAEMFTNAALGLLLLVFVVIGVLLGGLVHSGTGPWLGLVAGLLLGTACVASLYRRRH
jgi:uncharacterized protein (DUF952 family)